MMKKIFVTLAAAGTLTLGLVSCSGTGNKQAQAQQNTIDSLKTEMVKKQIIDSMNEVARQQPIMVNQEMIPVASPAPEVIVKHEVKHTSPRRHTAKRTHSRGHSTFNDNGNSDYASNNSSYQGSSNNYQGATPVAYTEQSQPAPQPQKKGWSAKATGSLIGVGAGAAAGALIGKKKGLGALIGGAVGAAAGLGTGAYIDHRNGR